MNKVPRPTATQISFECLLVLYNLIAGRKHMKLVVPEMRETPYLTLSDDDLGLCLGMGFSKGGFPVPPSEIYEATDVKDIHVTVECVSEDNTGSRASHRTSFSMDHRDLDQLSALTMRPALAKMAELLIVKENQ